MKNREKNFVSRLGLIVALIFFAAILYGCARVVPYAPEDVRPAQSGDPVAPIQLNATAADAGGWRKFQDERFSFHYPPSWQLRVEESSVALPGRAKNRIRLKSINKEIVLGALAPDDYYFEQNGIRRINEEKYADRFISITVDVYEGGDYPSWPAFFRLVYPDVVDYARYSLEIRPELEAVSADRINGAYAGSPRIFIKSGDAVYDFALFCRGDRCDDAKSIFNAFILNFVF